MADPLVASPRHRPRPRPAANGSILPPLGSDWPGLRREPLSGARPLIGETIKRQLALDPAGLARFTDGAPIATDDNQLLEYAVSPFRSKRRVAEMITETHALIEAARDPSKPEPLNP